MKRRSFLKSVGIGAAAAVVGSALPAAEAQPGVVSPGLTVPGLSPDFVEWAKGQNPEDCFDKVPERDFWDRIMRLVRELEGHEVLYANDVGFKLLLDDWRDRSYVSVEEYDRVFWFMGIPVFKALLNADPSEPHVAKGSPPRRICNIRLREDIDWGPLKSKKQQDLWVGPGEPGYEQVREEMAEMLKPREVVNL